MGARADIQAAVSSVLAGSTWSGNSIKTIPQNFNGNVGANEFVRVNIIATAGNTTTAATNQYRGILRFDVFVEAGRGWSRVYEICDLLDDVFQRATLRADLQTGTSSTEPRGEDPSNAGLFRMNYSVPFTYYS